MSPLHYAVWGGNDDIAEFLIEKGADIDAISQENGRPLSYQPVEKVHLCQDDCCLSLWFGPMIYQVQTEKGGRANGNGKTRPTETGKPVHRIEHFGEISGSSVQREAESGIGGERVRRVRRRALPAVLRSSYGSQGHSARGLFSDAFDWVFRGA